MMETDQNIRKLLVQSEKEYTLNTDMEHTIMDKINTQKNYSTLLLKTQRRARIGLMVSTILLGVYAFVTYYELIYSDRHNLSLDYYYPTFFTTIVVILIYFLMTFSNAVLHKVSKREAM